MASWLQSQLHKAESLIERADRAAHNVSVVVGSQPHVDDAAGENSGTAAGADATRAVGGGAGEQATGPGGAGSTSDAAAAAAEAIAAASAATSGAKASQRRKARPVESRRLPEATHADGARAAAGGRDAADAPADYHDGGASSEGSSREARLQRLCDSLGDKLSESQAEVEALERMCAEHQLARNTASKEAAAAKKELVGAQAQATALAAQAKSQAGKLAKERDTLLARLGDAERAAAAAETRLAEAKAAGAQAPDTGSVPGGADAGDERPQQPGGPDALDVSAPAGLLTSLRADLAARERALAEERKEAAAAREEAAGRIRSLDAALSATRAEATRASIAAVDAQKRATDAESKAAILEAENTALVEQSEAAEAALAREAAVRAQNDGAANAQQQQLADAKLELEAARAEVDAMRDALALERRQKEAMPASAPAPASLQSEGGGAESMQRRFAELTELLYAKQTALERAQSDKSSLERRMAAEIAAARDEAERVARIRAQAESQASSAVSSLDAHGGGVYEQIGRAPAIGPQVQTAARVLDRGAITFGRVLSQNPLLRLWVVLYALFVHCFVYMLLHRLQRLARAEDLINLREPNELDEAKAAFVGRG